MNFARTLVKKGYATTEREALTKYLHKGGSAYVECKYPPFSTVAQKVHDAGGVVSLAHPVEYGIQPQVPVQESVLQPPEKEI